MSDSIIYVVEMNNGAEWVPTRDVSITPGQAKVRLRHRKEAHKDTDFRTAVYKRVEGGE